jgi:hypothetical protein
MDEMLRSQDKMLERLGRKGAPHDQIKKSYLLHLEKLSDWLRQQKNIDVLYVSYNDLVERAEEQGQRVSKFLGGRGSVEDMVQAVDPSLYRNRKSVNSAASDVSAG